MTDQAQESKLLFLAGDRGDRLRPSRLNRNYWHLRLLLEKLQSIVNSDLVEPGEKVLDYGCGSKPYKQILLTKFREYFGADISGNRVAELTLGPQGELPVENGSFDCILSTEVLEHTADPVLYLREAHRALRLGGYLILSAPAIWVYHPDPIDYWRWTIDGLRFLIKAAGFEIVMVKGVFGPESSALQLWQDSTFERLPRFLRSTYTGFIQFIIGVIEKRQPEKLSNDAAGYVILARKGMTK